MTCVATIFYWLISQTVRNACAAHKHHQRQLDAQQDILPEPAIATLRLKLDELHDAIRSRQSGNMNLKMAELRAAGTQLLVPCQHAHEREVMEILLVAFVVALSIRTYFLQPFKIPSGSMQPTLYGVNTTPDFTEAVNGLDAIAVARAEFREVRPRFIARIQAEYARESQAGQSLVVPSFWPRFKQWFQGISYVRFVAPTDGGIEQIQPPWPSKILGIYQKVKFAGQWHTLWFPPEYGDSDLSHRAGLTYGHIYQRGEDVIKLRVAAGDYLLVDRLSYNFVKPQRGEIVVFGTGGSQIHDPGEYYIKRLVGLPGEHLQIGDDRHLIIDGRRLDASTPHFDKVYGFDPAQPPQDSIYSGHVNGTVDREFRLGPGLSPLFPDADTVYTNGPDTYLFMGDNTCNSSDSRAWGGVPTGNVIGKSFFVCWPLTSRFGFTD